MQNVGTALNPWRLFDEIAGRADRLSHPLGSTAASAFPMDVLEADDHLLVKIDVPGAEPGSLDVSLENNTLSIAVKIEDGGGENVRYLHRERPAGSVRRAVTLPVRLNAERMQASLEDGVLTVRVEKAPEATAKKIAVSAGSRPQAIEG